MAKPHCQACLYEKYKVKSSSPPSHVCEKSDPKYVDPTTRNFSGEEETFIRITSQVAFTSKATKWKLKNNQWINGYKVKASNNEVWLPNHLHIFNHKEVEKGIWVKKRVLRQDGVCIV